MPPARTVATGTVKLPCGLMIWRPSRESCSARRDRTRNVTSRPARVRHPPKYPPIAPAPITRMRIEPFPQKLRDRSAIRPLSHNPSSVAACIVVSASFARGGESPALRSRQHMRQRSGCLEKPTLRPLSITCHHHGAGERGHSFMSEPLTHGWRDVHVDRPHNRRVGANALYFVHQNRRSARGSRRCCGAWFLCLHKADLSGIEHRRK